jgi:hypothetical protein
MNVIAPSKIEAAKVIRPLRKASFILPAFVFTELCKSHSDHTPNDEMNPFAISDNLIVPVGLVGFITYAVLAKRMEIIHSEKSTENIANAW